MVAQNELTVFILMNALDVFMTYWMLNHGGFRESNPIALYFINHWGVKGMVGFKFSVVAFVCILAHIVGQYRPERASQMLVVGSLIVGGVVVYSWMQYQQHAGALM